MRPVEWWTLGAGPFLERAMVMPLPLRSIHEPVQPTTKGDHRPTCPGTPRRLACQTTAAKHNLIYTTQRDTASWKQRRQLLSPCSPSACPRRRRLSHGNLTVVLSHVWPCATEHRITRSRASYIQGGLSRSLEAAFLPDA